MFKLGLGLYMLLALVQVLAIPSLLGVVWPGVLAIAAWRTLAGSLAASRVFATMLVIVSVLFALPLVYGLAHDPASKPESLFAAVFLGSYVVLGLGLAAYTFFGADMRAVHRRSERSKWSGA